MKVRDLLSMDVDIDVYDDVCEELGVAFCGPIELTDAGMEAFGEVLDYDCEELAPPCGYGLGCVIVHVDGENWKHKLHMAKELFESLAGYCAFDDYGKWFREVE